MKVRHTLLPYLLLVLWAAISMSYYVVGVDGLYQEWFRGDRHAALPFTMDDQNLVGLNQEAKDAGLAEGDILETLNGLPFSGKAQLTQYLFNARPGDVMVLGVNGPHSAAKTVRLHLKRIEGPDFTLGGLIAFLTPVLGVPLLGL